MTHNTKNIYYQALCRKCLPIHNLKHHHSSSREGTWTLSLLGAGAATGPQLICLTVGLWQDPRYSLNSGKCGKDGEERMNLNKSWHRTSTTSNWYCASRRRRRGRNLGWGSYLPPSPQGSSRSVHGDRIQSAFNQGKERRERRQYCWLQKVTREGEDPAWPAER